MYVCGKLQLITILSPDSCAVQISRSKSTQAAQDAAQQQQETKQSDQEQGDRYETDIRERILEASLPFVNDLGWSKEALSAGAESAGYPGITHGMFSGAGADLALYFQKRSNERLVEFLKKHRSDLGGRTVPPAQFVETACKERLQMIVPHITRWPQAIAIMSLPANVPNSLATLLAMVDDICYHAGDRSVDFNWYARRVVLAGIYKTSELYMLQDNSSQYEATWKFLNRRITEAVQLQDLISKGDGVGQGAKDTITAAFTTARNILGLNNRFM